MQMTNYACTEPNLTCCELATMSRMFKFTKKKKRVLLHFSVTITVEGLEKNSPGQKRVCVGSI